MLGYMNIENISTQLIINLLLNETQYCFYLYQKLSTYLSEKYYLFETNENQHTHMHTHIYI